MLRETAEKVIKAPWVHPDQYGVPGVLAPTDLHNSTGQLITSNNN
jgi:hypothetical protein